MGKLSSAVRLVVALASINPAASRSEELRPYDVKLVRLQTLSGTLYLTPRGGDYLLSATFGEEPRPVRFVTALLPEQRVELSTPPEPGEPTSVVEIRRDGDRVVYEIKSRSADPAPSPGEADMLSGP